MRRVCIWITLFCFFHVAAIFHGPIEAGECHHGADFYVDILEQGPDAEFFSYALFCLSAIWSSTNPLWASPLVAKKFQHRRLDPLRLRISVAAEKLIHTEWAAVPKNRIKLLKILAGRGIDRLDIIDVFDAIVEEVRPLPYKHLAVLQDPRTIEFIAKRYKDIRSGRTKKDNIREDLDLLNCLYHIPGNKTIETAKSLLEEEQDPLLRKSLQQIINRK